MAEELRRNVGLIASELEDEERLKDHLVAASRRVVKEAGDAVISVHAGRLSEAASHLEEAGRLLREAMDRLGPHVKYMYQGPLVQAMQEYVEALTLYRLVTGGGLPSHRELGVPAQAYIHGLAEVAGEVRRRVLDLLRRDEVDEAERWLEVLEAIYSELKSLELYRGVVDDIKWRVDNVRRVLEATRGDIAVAVQRKRLREEMRRLEERLRRA